MLYCVAASGLLHHITGLKPGPGYRVYFTRRGEVVYLLLLGGDKSSQKRDIKRATDMARALDKE
jgi:putative addiction module killer protein